DDGQKHVDREQRTGEEIAQRVVCVLANEDLAERERDHQRGDSEQEPETRAGVRHVAQLDARQTDQPRRPRPGSRAGSASPPATCSPATASISSSPGPWASRSESAPCSPRYTYSMPEHRLSARLTTLRGRIRQLPEVEGLSDQLVIMDPGVSSDS